MAKELTIPNLTAGGVDYYARFVNAIGQYWRGDTSAWETYDAGNVALYGADAGSGSPYNAATEVGATGDFTIDVPGLAAGSYKCLVYQQAGAEPAQDDEYVGGGGFEWSGSALVTRASRSSHSPADVRAALLGVAADITDALTGANISRRRGDTWSIEITGLGDLTDQDKLWLTVKELDDEEADDADALLQITEGDGLLVLNRSSDVTDTDASITIDDDAAGDITVAVAASVTAQLPRGTYRYDLQKLEDEDEATENTETIAEGQFTISADVTRSTS